MLQIDDHAAAHDVDDIRTENTRRKQIELELAEFVDNGVSRV